jgi:hypothetical protein
VFNLHLLYSDGLSLFEVKPSKAASSPTIFKRMYRLTIPILLLIISSCGIPKETLEKFNKTLSDTAHFPIDYCLSLPVLDTAEWDNNYIAYDKFLSNDIMRTQAGISSYFNGVYTYM